MATPKITLYVDIVSPFAYIAYYVARHSPVFAKCQVDYVPIFLGGVMKDTGNTPPLKIKNKDKWINIERLRWAKFLNVPIVKDMLDPFPINTIAVQRALCAVSISYPQKLIPCIDALYNFLWVDGKSTQMEKPEGFAPVLEKVLGKEAAADVLQKIASQDAKALLASNTTRALESGAFGLPWLECTNAKGETESFWGVDHLGQVALFLGLDTKGDQGFRALL